MGALPSDLRRVTRQEPCPICGKATWCLAGPTRNLCMRQESRWPAKSGWRGGLNFTEVEVLNDDLGKPAFNFLGKTSQIIEELNLTHIHLSLSHLAQIAVAVVILEK